MINFNVPLCMDESYEYMRQTVAAQQTSGNGAFSKKCCAWLEEKTGVAKAMLTTSCTASLEMAAWLCGIQPGDEVILPSFTFSSTANAFVGRGAHLVFVDINPDTMNIDETKVEEAITSKTRAICCVHYAGVACNMEALLAIAREHNIALVEDAAQCVMASYKGQALGTFGDYGCLSFHESKNYSMGEGGGLLIRDIENWEPAEILWEKGTDRSKFYRGQIDKYTWVEYGSSYLPSELNAAFLWAQLERAEEINADRLATWNGYYDALKPLEDEGLLRLPKIPEGCEHNAHIFHVKLADLNQRNAFLAFTKKHGVATTFHYIPLHSAPAGLKYGHFAGKDEHTTVESERLARLPMYYGVTDEDREKVIDTVWAFFGRER